jgi:hypothetical protein
MHEPHFTNEFRDAPSQQLFILEQVGLHSNLNPSLSAGSGTFTLLLDNTYLNLKRLNCSNGSEKS